MDPLYEIKEKPDYNPEIRALKNEDPVNADQVLNPILQKIINNTHAVKQFADSVEKRIEELQDLTSANLTIYDEKESSTQQKRVVDIPWVKSYSDLSDRVLTIRPVVSSDSEAYTGGTININGMGEKDLRVPAHSGDNLVGNSPLYAYAIKRHVPYMITYYADQDTFGLINPQWAQASMGRMGVVQLEDSLTSTSTTAAATANAVKKVYTDLQEWKERIHESLEIWFMLLTTQSEVTLPVFQSDLSLIDLSYPITVEIRADYLLQKNGYENYAYDESLTNVRLSPPDFASLSTLKKWAFFMPMITEQKGEKVIVTYWSDNIRCLGEEEQQLFKLTFNNLNVNLASEFNPTMEVMKK